MNKWWRRFFLENMLMSVCGHLAVVAIMVTSFALVLNRAQLVAPDRIQIIEIDLDSVVVSGDETKLYNVGVPEKKSEKQPEKQSKKIDTENEKWLEVAMSENKKVKEAIKVLENGEKVRKMLLSQVALLSENPAYVLDRLINTSLYYRTGLANPKSGTNITVSRFRSLDAKDYLARVFTPRNTIISAVGDVSQEEIYDLVKLYFFDRMKDTETEYKKLKYVSEIDEFVGCAKGRVKRLNQTRIRYHSIWF